MKKIEITAGNKLIAYFMGGKKVTVMSGGVAQRPQFWNSDELESVLGGCRFTDETLKYHSDWNWLMPVIEKAKERAYQIWNDNEDVEPLELKINFWLNEVEWIDTETGWSPFQAYGSHSGSLIENIWKALIDFIKFYNTKAK